MKKKLFAIILALAVLFGICACSAQRPETSSIESNLIEINKGIEQFSELKNGTLEVHSSLMSENNAVESLNTASNGTSIITFILNRKGYDFIEEANYTNKKTGEIHYSATKQANGVFFFAHPVDSLSKERTKSYVWEDTGEPNGTGYEPNGALRMMAVPAKLIGSNKKYIESVTRAKDGSLVKYTVTTNDAYAKYLKEEAHSAEENYIVHGHREIYWINEDGLLVKRQSCEESEMTIDSIADTYIFDMTIELTGFNYKKLSEIGDELLPMIMFEGELYTQSQTLLLAVNLGALSEIGTIESVVGSVQEPEQNNQANRSIKNAIVYRSGENGIIVKYDGYSLYEKSF